MKKHAALMVVGGILALIGLLAAIAGANLSPSASEFEIPSGGDYYNVRDVYVPSGGELKVDFKVTGGTTVDFYVFTPTQYADYEYDGHAQSVASTSGSSGSVTVRSSQGGTYHMVFDHGTGYENAVQKGTVNHRVIGVNVPVLAFGIAILVLGIALIAYGLRIRKKETVTKRNWMYQQPSGVLYFKEEKPPRA